MPKAYVLLLDAGAADCYGRLVDGEPAGGSGEALLITDPPDVGACVGEDVDGALQLPHSVEPLLKIIKGLATFCVQ